MTRKDKILIIVTAVLLAVLVFGFWNDRNTYMLKRTTSFDMTDDMKLISMDKSGMLLWRTAYEAKIEILSGDIDSVRAELTEAYADAGNDYKYDDYLELSQDVFEGETLYPVPSADTPVWVQTIETDGGHEITNMIDTESDGTYLYIYYSR